MKSSLGLVLCCLIGYTVAAPKDKQTRCWSSGNGLAAQWWSQGTRIDRGRFWYECRNGELEPMGCFTDNRERLYIYGTFIKNGYEMQCVLGADNYLQFIYTACSPDGISRYKPGDTWEDSRRMYFYQCRKDGDFIRAEIAGCLSHDKSRRINVNERYDDDQFVYECLIKETGAAQMCSVGCVHDGKRYDIGEQWPEGDYVYYCKSENGRCKKDCVGCQFNNKRLYDGDRYTKEKTVYQCEIRPSNHKHRPVACSIEDASGNNLERVIGCRWYAESTESKVELTCEQDEEFGKAEVKTLGCIYVQNGFDTLFVRPNTYTLWTQSMDKPAKAVACKEIGTNEYRLETFAPEEIASRGFGLKYESPRG